MKKNIHIETKTTYNGQQMKDTNSYVEHKPSYTVKKENEKKKKYAIGLYSFEEDIEVVIIEAQNGLSAMCDAVLNKYNWEVRNKEQLPFSTVDEAINFFLQGEINISKPVEI